MPQRARRHHIVPQLFLRRFVGRRHLIRMHDLETEQDQDISPKQAAWELDYYTVETATGPSDAIKRHCREAKRSPPQRCRDIDAGNFPPSDATRGATASFMAMQFARGTTTRIVTADR